MSNSNTNTPPKILLQVTGSIAAFKAIALCSKLTQNGFQVEVILSKGAEEFVGAASFEGLTRRKVHRGNFDEGSMMAHIDLERWADLILLYPASANSLAELGLGQANSLIGTLFLAHEFKKPYFIYPAMNQAMLKHPETQAHIAKLRAHGIKVFEPDTGTLACGEVGSGRLVEPEAVLTQLLEHFKLNKNITHPQNSKRILITSGGTREPIDAVRSVINFSTGKTGLSLATALQSAGMNVTLLQSMHSVHQRLGLPTIPYDTTLDFETKLKHELETNAYDFLIHAAAVADYAIEKVETLKGEVLDTHGKLQSDETIKLVMKPNPKIIQSVRKWSLNPKLKVISFKLTDGEESAPNLKKYDSDYILHNELSGVTENKHQGTLYSKNGDQSYSPKTTFQTKEELNQLVLRLIQEGAV